MSNSVEKNLVEFFPCSSGSFIDIISRKKNQPHGWPAENEAASIQKTYPLPESAPEPMNVDSDAPPPRRPTTLKKGKKLRGGYKPFLSNKGATKHLVRYKNGEIFSTAVDFESLAGKHLLICCSLVPISGDDSAVDNIRAAIEAFDHGQRQPFEMVVVVKMRNDVVYDHKSAFDHFYSAFPDCLAVPFSDVATREYVCSSFDIDDEMTAAVLVDPDGHILVDPYETLENFLLYGSEWSPPFLDSALVEIQDNDEALRCRFDPMHEHWSHTKDRTRLSLFADILQCNPNRTLRRFESESADVASAVSVLDLAGKYVGLYFCFDGKIMERIKTVHDYCMSKNQQLEIVLVCMSLFDEPASYYRQLYSALGLCGVKSWLLFDYDGKVCRRMWRVFGSGDEGPVERFVVVPPNCESGELRGREIVTSERGVEEYPFTRSAILKRKVESIRSLAPIHSSLLKTGLSRKGEYFDPKQLRGKNYLVYLGSRRGFNDRELAYIELVRKHYPEMKAMGWEVVFVPLDLSREHFVSRQNGEGVRYRSLWKDEEMKMPWPVMSASAAAEASMEEMLTFPEFLHEEEGEEVYYGSCIVAVGKDGNVVSNGVEKRLKRDGVTESLFDDVLESELARESASMPFPNYGCAMCCN